MSAASRQQKPKLHTSQVRKLLYRIEHNLINKILRIGADINFKLQFIEVTIRVRLKLNQESSAYEK